MIQFQNVTHKGQIKEGDKLLLEPRAEDHEILCVIARRVQVSSSGGEEVIFNLSKNKFFNVGMLVEGISWVKRAAIVRRMPDELFSKDAP